MALPASRSTPASSTSFDGVCAAALGRIAVHVTMLSSYSPCSFCCPRSASPICLFLPEDWSMQSLGHAAHLPSPNFLSGGCLSDGLLHPSFLDLPERRPPLELRFVPDLRRQGRPDLFLHSAGSRWALRLPSPTWLPSDDANNCYEGYCHLPRPSCHLWPLPRSPLSEH